MAKSRTWGSDIRASGAHSARMKVARVLAVVRPQRLALWPNLFVYPAMRRLPLSSLIARPFTSSPPPPPPPSDLDQKRTKRNRSLLYYLMAFTVAMLALSYASVPLYRLFCQVTGLGGTTQRSAFFLFLFLHITRDSSCSHYLMLIIYLLLFLLLVCDGPSLFCVTSRRIDS